ncbi:uncharacterized protein I303_103527 [Kwoniella dejecticola CBS 10117]|uniref:F-actin capping n=1 Tax=Kwoniella dejecticola CBS 10117 TaxID=1296121 RepID=A0A1A6A702_9TREE|nr:F-actin capping [Kwoniella dejecticola CBS 10117]OBR85837.1 F-actin capping [Kwoniella dejecticola CBS 10117]
MAELSLEEKCKLAAKFVEQSPPGEINDVINDIRAVINDDTALMPHVLPTLRAYNLTQLHVVDHPATDGVPAHSSILSEATVLPGTEGDEERFVDAEGKRSFEFDHITLAITDYQPYELPEEEESFRAALAQSLAKYTKNHFPSGQASVSSSQYPLLPSAAPTSEPAAAAAAVPSDETTSAPQEQVEPEVEAKESKTQTPVTDIVDEQVNEGDLEPAPTPASGDLDGTKEKDELVRPESLDQLDELVEEAKEEEEKEGTKSETAAKPDIGEVEEDGKEEQLTTPKAEENPLPAVEEEKEVRPEQKQQRVENPKYTLEAVGNKYNPNNFWTGRWRTRWVVDKAAGVVDGKINVDVHYYEQGNVQLATSHSASFPLPTEEINGQTIPSQIVTTISKIETAYHLELNDVYGELGDKAFRALRRALPVTRQKMDWEKVTGYSLGSDLTKARA